MFHMYVKVEFQFRLFQPLKKKKKVNEVIHIYPTAGLLSVFILGPSHLDLLLAVIFEFFEFI